MFFEAIKTRSIRSRFLIVGLAFIVAFSMLCIITTEPASAASKVKTAKITLYKGQKIKVYHTVIGYKGKVTLSSSKKSVATIKKGKKSGSQHNFTYVAKKKGKATVTLKAGKKVLAKFKVTVKPYPAGSKKKPLALGSNWATLKSLDGKKQVKIKSQIYKNQAAIDFMKANGAILNPDLEASVLNPAYTASNAFYLIRYDYDVVKGFPASSPCNLNFLTSSYKQYNKSWQQLTNIAGYSVYPLQATAVGLTNGTKGSFYTAYVTNGSSKGPELYQFGVSNIQDYHRIAAYNGTLYNVILSGCTKTVLP